MSLHDSCRNQVCQYVLLLQKSSMSICITPGGVKYASMYDSCRSQVSQCVTPAGVKYVNMYDSCSSQVSLCMTPAGVKYLNV